jgi:hypothetical protein
MRRFCARALALAVTTLALLVPAAHAVPPAPKGEGKPVFNYIIDFIPFTYWDADYTRYGPGQLILLHVGNDPNNDAILIKVLLKQGGREYTGSGTVVGNKVLFSVGPYFFQCDTPGWGSYHVAGKPDKLYWVYLEKGFPPAGP